MRPFAYHRAADVADALASLGGQAAVLAGGTTLVDLMKLEVMTPATLVDITGIAELTGFDTSGDPLRFGALARMADVARDPVLEADYPALPNRSGRPPRRSSGTRRRSEATCCSARAATIFATGPMRATGVRPAPAARPRTASTAATPSSAARTIASRPTLPTGRSPWSPSTRCCTSARPAVSGRCRSESSTACRATRRTSRRPSKMTS
jgi:hypothetical protein